MVKLIYHLIYPSIPSSFFGKLATQSLLLNVFANLCLRRPRDAEQYAFEEFLVNLLNFVTKSILIHSESRHSGLLDGEIGFVLSVDARFT